MSKYYFTKAKKKNTRKYVRVSGLLISLIGLTCLLYFSFPVASFYFFMTQVYASQNFTTPIPKNTILTKERVKRLLLANANPLAATDYTDAQNWFPSLEINPTTPRVTSYTISIPTIGIKNATVSTQDYNVAKHLINYGGTAVPPDKGNAVIFGHSTLPQLYNSNDYKTVFAKLHTLQIGDTIHATVENKEYTYKVVSIKIVDPEDFSPLAQDYDASYMTLITCTPPGTIWERLIVRAKLISEEN